LGRTYDAASFEVGQVAGNVVRDGELLGNDDLIPLRNSEQLPVEGPVTHPTQCHAVGRPVVVHLAPWPYVRRRDGRMTVESTDTNATQGAAVGVCGNYRPSKARIRRLC
jgi:hypothetical protein